MLPLDHRGQVIFFPFLTSVQLCAFFREFQIYPYPTYTVVPKPQPSPARVKLSLYQFQVMQGICDHHTAMYMTVTWHFMSRSESIQCGPSMTFWKIDIHLVDRNPYWQINFLLIEMISIYHKKSSKTSLTVRTVHNETLMGSTLFFHISDMARGQSILGEHSVLSGGFTRT